MRWRGAILRENLFLDSHRSLSNRKSMAQKTCYAASKNKEPILNVLRPLVEEIRRETIDSQLKVLEIASGTGEHANLFASAIDKLHYQPTEPQLDMHESIVAWTSSITGSTVNQPLALDVSDTNCSNLLPSDFSNGMVDVMICINMIHISPFRCTEGLFSLACKCLRPGGFLLTYGPYKVNGQMVESNVAFDESLRARNPEWGVRAVEDLEALAAGAGLQLARSVSMPANNLSLIFIKRALKSL